MIYITRRERFNAAHRLFLPNLNDAENLNIFGKCSNPNWHGHNYELFVTIKGNTNQETGFLMNLTDLSFIIKKYIIEPLDHKNINLEVPFMKNIVPTTENLAMMIWKQIEPHLIQYNVKLHCVKIVETENNFVEYFG